MPNISLTHGSIRISLTAAEARNYGFHSLQPHFLQRTLEDDGSVTLHYSSEHLQPGPRNTSIVAWIPPLQISPASVASQDHSIKSPGVVRSS